MEMRHAGYRVKHEERIYTEIHMIVIWTIALEFQRAFGRASDTGFIITEYKQSVIITRANITNACRTLA